MAVSEELMVARDETMNLQDRLRAGTRPAQDAEMAAVEAFDLTRPAGLAGFLAARMDAFDAMARAAPTNSPERAELKSLMGLLRADLDALGLTGFQPASKPVPRTDDETAREYVRHATALGLRRLGRDWRETLDETLRGAGRYLEARRDAAGWRALCAELEEEVGVGARAERVLEATNDWFALFETAAHERRRR